MRKLITTWVSLALIIAACSGQNGLDPAVDEGQMMPELSLDVIGPATALVDYGAMHGGGGQEDPQPEDLPDPFEVLASLFSLDGRIAVAFSPFEIGPSTCLEAHIETTATLPKTAAAPVTAGVVCASFSPLVTSATPGSLLVCSEVLFLTTDWPIEALRSEEEVISARVAGPLHPDGVTWIGGLFVGPVAASSIPEVDLSELNCETSPDLALSEDVPVLIDGVTQQLGIVERADGGLQVSFSSLGDGPPSRAGEYSALAAEWGEIVREEGGRVEVRHSDGRYVTFVATGGPGPMEFEICEWTAEPADGNCS